MRSLIFIEISRSDFENSLRTIIHKLIIKLSAI